MSKRRREGPMPAVTAGLLRFFEEKTEGIKIRPEIIIGMAITLSVVSIALNFIL